MTVHFRDIEEYHTRRYDGKNNPGDHLIECQTLLESWPKDEWFHAFVHMMDDMSRSWYVSAELRREITTWEELTIWFTYTLIFVDTNPTIHYSLKHIRDVVLKVVPVAYPMDLHERCTI